MVVYALAAIATGVALTMYSTGTVTDPYWGRSTRRVGLVGLVTGLVTIFLGLAVLMVEAS